MAASCAKARPDVVGAPRCVNWKEDIAPLFRDRCSSCHSGPAAAAGYDTGSYAGVMGGGSDAVANATAGDASSRLLSTLDPASADRVHQAVSDVSTTVRTWVVDCNLSFVQSSIHGGGILDPASPDFHGKVLRDQKYDFQVCQKCHGDDFSGGTSRVACLSCHKEGPTACATCHGSLAQRGTHAAHLGGGKLGKTFACAECHVVPSVYTDVGHIFLADGSLDPAPAEVKLGATAALTLAGAANTRVAAPSFDAVTQSCSNIYCHGATLGDSAAGNTEPRWNSPGTGQGDCGSCHGLPPNHSGTMSCVSCHPSVVDKDRKVISSDKHINGRVDFGDPAAGCSGCHGTMFNAAPPPAPGGETATSVLGVGAHQAHVRATAHLRGPIACNDCHRVPAEVSSPGHITGHAAGAVDTEGAEVFPPDPTVGVLASSDGAAPGWDRQTATCSNVYCHGGGVKLGSDATPDVARAPVWTAAAGSLTCGTSCHGLPPTLAPHLPTMTRLDCGTCHTRTVDPAGQVIVSGPPGAETSAHINGVVDVGK
ncbi:MAG TPA: CxxxxCH/CxxCH domain-containing protein [Polyangia bacterium]|nr:CxxxxCH/CxxCH domain-containing protein [Polyangia bacterium]